MKIIWNFQKNFISLPRCYVLTVDLTVLAEAFVVAL